MLRSRFFKVADTYFNVIRENKIVLLQLCVGCFVLVMRSNYIIVISTDLPKALKRDSIYNIDVLF